MCSGSLAVRGTENTQTLALNCYICAENNLEEFGECATTFQYDCGPYSQRYPNDKVFCRTMRTKALNGSYGVTKECITESNHFKTFPRKGYPLDEDCDMIEVDGQEVAYCLCQSEFCNRPPIVDQFIAFENTHPELFAQVPGDAVTRLGRSAKNTGYGLQKATAS
ncbi:Protein W06A11.1 [Aphelenchoides avenae]|nr:Protein W06A11.1 [Aphelenchus avenae]